MNLSHDDRSEYEIVLTRLFDAPRSLVWRAWTEAELVSQWWGPAGFSTRVDELDLRVGGAWRYVMVDSDGKEYPAKGIFIEVVPEQRIVTTDEFGEGHESLVGIDLPQGIVTTAEFEEIGNQTQLTLRIEHRSEEDRQKHEAMGVVPGWNSSFDCLKETLAKLRDASSAQPR